MRAPAAYPAQSHPGDHAPATAPLLGEAGSAAAARSSSSRRSGNNVVGIYS